MYETVKDQNLEQPEGIDLADAREYFDEEVVKEGEWRELYERKVIAVFDLYGDSISYSGKSRTVFEVHKQACNETFEEWCNASYPGFLKQDGD